jgi:hypothetical protein
LKGAIRGHERREDAESIEQNTKRRYADDDTSYGLLLRPHVDAEGSTEKKQRNLQEGREGLNHGIEVPRP